MITESLGVEIKRHKLGVAVVLAIVLAVAGLGAFGIYKFANRKPEVVAFQNIHLARLTNSGDVIDVTISPDGKYIVYVRSDRNNQSLWIRQVSTANDKEIVPASAVGFFGITFSPDGNDVYYAIKANLDPGTLYRIPTLGGLPVKVLEKIDAPVSFAPDGKRFVLVRGNYPNPGESALVIANVDGGDERILAVRQRPYLFSPIFFTGPSWSPDGKLIAATMVTSPRVSNVVVVSVEDGKQQVLTREPWVFAGRVQWLPDMSGLLVVAGDGVNTSQHWILSYPSGEKRRITNDLSAYRVISLTSTGEKLATIQIDGLINVWVAPDADAAQAVRLPIGNVGFYAAAGNNLSWTTDKRILYMSSEGGVPDIWVADANGGNRKQLTAKGGASPVASADGKFVVFVSARDGRLGIWRMNIDGSDPVRLSSGPADVFPSLTPDGKWVVYTNNAGVKPTLWKVSIDGGTPEQLTDHVASSAVVSPDGKMLAYAYPESPDSFAPPNRVAVVNFPDMTPVTTFNFGPSSTVPTLIQWSPDGKSIRYSVNRNSVSNVWSQSIEGGEPKQVTQFRESLMTGFAWSNDGKMFAATRGTLLRDAVLISDLR